MKERLMRSVMTDANEPLGDTYAKGGHVRLRHAPAQSSESREVLNEIGTRAAAP